MHLTIQDGGTSTIFYKYRDAANYIFNISRLQPTNPFTELEVTVNGITTILTDFAEIKALAVAELTAEIDRIQKMTL